MAENNEILEYEVVSFYKFVKLSENELDFLASELKELAETHLIKGLIITATEGLNGTVASPRGKLVQFTNYLESKFPGGDWRYKYSYSHKKPFKRFAVRVREEIVTSGFPDYIPGEHDESHLSPEEWHKVLTSGEKVHLIDTRNDYEYEVGRFKGAIDPATRTFREFPEWVKSSGIDPEEKVLMYCTGGIRCEKAYIEMKELGYNNVYQLDGGILTYMEQFPEGEWEGECFVFDDRVALDKNLAPSATYGLCPHCGDPARDYITCVMCEGDKKVCVDCQKTEKGKTCSKNCAYHYNLKLNKESGNQGEIMKKVVCAVIIFFSLIFNSRILFADQGPSDVVREAIKKVQTMGDPSPLVDYVDWSVVYEKMPANSKELMKVSSESELKDYYRQILKSPSEAMSGLLSGKLKDLSGDKAQAGEQILAKLKEKMAEKEVQIKERIKNSKYTIGDATIEGDTAKVSVSHEYEGKKKKEVLDLRKKDGVWLLSNLGEGFSMGGMAIGK